MLPAKSLIFSKASPKNGPSPDTGVENMHSYMLPFLEQVPVTKFAAPNDEKLATPETGPMSSDTLTVTIIVSPIFTYSAVAPSTS